MKNIKFTNQIIQEFLKYLDSNKYSKSTINSYYFAIKDLSNYFLKNNIEIINVNSIEKYKNYLVNKNNAPQTTNAKIFAVKKFIKYLNEYHNFNLSVRNNYIKIAGKKDISYISPSDFNNIIDEINKNSNKIIASRDKLFFILQYYTGIKTKDLLKIKKTDINRNLLTVGAIKIFINKVIKDEIENYFNLLSPFKNSTDNVYLFFSFANKKYNFNKHLTEKSIQDFFKKYTKFLNKKLSIMDLRNSYFTNLYKFQIDIEIDKINKFSSFNFDGEYLELKKAGLRAA